MAKKQAYHHGDLRRALLDAAVALLQRESVNQLSLRAVAREAGVSHAAPYRHFEDKSALIEAVAEEGFAEFERYLRRAVDASNDDPVMALQSTGVAYIRFALEHSTHFRVMFSASDGMIDPSSSLHKVSKGTFQILVDVIKAGQVAGLMRSGDPDFLALEKWATTHGLAMLILDGMIVEKGEDAIALAESLIQSNMTSLVKS